MIHERGASTAYDNVMTLRGIGYWVDLEEPWLQRFAASFVRPLPDPRRLVQPGWERERRASIVSYLRSGHELHHFMGYSYCRFDCGVDESEMGDKDLTDGVWVWPEGLPHYLEAHDVCVPDEFVAHAAATGFRPPSNVGLASLALREIDTTLWTSWAQKQRA